MGWKVGVAWIALAGCGRLGFDPLDEEVFRLPLTQEVAVSPVFSAASTLAVGGACVEGLPITVRGATPLSIPCIDGRWMAQIMRSETEGLERVEFFQERQDGERDRAAVEWMLDRTAPVFETTAETGEQTVIVPSVGLSVRARDESPLTDVCTRYASTTVPTEGDPCWRSLDALLAVPADPVQQVELSAPVGFVPGPYTIRVWLRDAAGNASSLLAAGGDGVDRLTVLYEPGSPPRIDSPFLVNALDAGNPPGTDDRRFTIGSDVYVVWDISDDEGLEEVRVSLDVTEDDVSYRSIATELSAGGNCTAAGFDGCFRWGSGAPSADFFRVRIGARDGDGLRALAETEPANAEGLETVAGKLFSGMGGFATAVAFETHADDGDLRIGDPSSLVVLDNGTLFFKDQSRGLLRIDSATGAVEVFVPETGAETGDGGPASEATLEDLHQIAGGFDDRIYLYDTDRIRVVDLGRSPATIDTLIGGGSETGDVVPARDLEFDANRETHEYKRTTMTVLPGGGLVFRATNPTGGDRGDKRLRVYDPTTGLVRSVVLRGLGVGDEPDQAIEQCGHSSWGVGFDPATGEIDRWVAMIEQVADQSSTCPNPGLPTQLRQTLTHFDADGSAIGGRAEGDPFAVFFSGLDGSIYRQYRSGIARYLPAEDRFEPLVGRGVGRCSDGTPALDCPTTIAAGFVTREGRLYFVDSNLVRVVADDGTVRTIAGEPRDSGDGDRALNARFGRVEGLSRYRDSGSLRIQVNDTEAYAVREISEEATSGMLTIDRLAGNGRLGAVIDGEVAIESPLFSNNNNSRATLIQTDVNGDLYAAMASGIIGRVRRSDGRWEALVGGGSTFFIDADGSVGTSLRTGFIEGVGVPAGLWNGTLLAARQRQPSGRTTVDVAWKLYDTTTVVQRTLLQGCGGPLTSCSQELNSDRSLGATFDDVSMRWLVSSMNGRSVYEVGEVGLVQTLTSTGRPIRAFTFVRNGGRRYLLYCGAGASSAAIYRRDIDAGTEEALAWPVPNLECVGNQMFYEAPEDALYFIGERDGQSAVLRYRNPLGT